MSGSLPMLCGFCALPAGCSGDLVRALRIVAEDNL